MKKTLLTIAAASLAVGAFGQGEVIFENDLGTGYITQNSSAGAKVAPGTYQVALLWFNGTSFQSIAVYTVANGSAGSGPGYFHDSTTVAVPTYTSTGTFEVQGWATTGNYSSYAAAAAGAGTTFIGQTASFASPEGNTLPPPNGVPAAPLSGSGGGWSGNLILVPVPEPSTIVLGGLGAAALLLFRRRK